MLNQFSRTELLYGPKAMERLNEASVAVFGVGGVGGYTVEALARAGIGKLQLSTMIKSALQISTDRYMLYMKQ